MAIQRTNAMVKEISITDVLNEDADKGHWVDLTEDSVHEMFSNLANFNEGDTEAECLDNRYNFKAYGADWYEQKFPGFPDMYYDILAAEHEALNAHLDKPIVFDSSEEFKQFDENYCDIAGENRRLVALNETSPDDYQ